MKQYIEQILRAGCLCLAVSLPSLFAQAGQSLTVVLPFDFQVNNQQFPAGKYYVKAGAGDIAVLLQGVQSKRSAITLSSPVSRGKTSDVGSLVFTRYSDGANNHRYFLSQIWMPGEYSGRGLRPGAAERETARRYAKASPNPTPDVVAVLAGPAVLNK